MKKFFTSLLVLVIIAGLGLFFGWAQRGIPPDGYGLLQSKTHGLDTRLIKPGEFRWVWYKLIPTNTKTVVFHLNPVHYEFSAHDTLPSGSIYSAFAGIDEAFSWELRAAFTYSLQSEAIVPLVTNNNIGNQEELEQYEKELAAEIEAYILRLINNDEFAPYVEDLLKNGDSPELSRAIQGHYPYIRQFSLTIKSATFPDFFLYRQTKGLYEAFITYQKDFLADELHEIARNRVDIFHRFGELEQYGALLTKYPILLEYLALEKDGK